MWLSACNVLHTHTSISDTGSLTIAHTNKLTHTGNAIALLIEAIRVSVVDQTMSIGAQAPEKSVFERFLADKERRFQVRI